MTDPLSRLHLSDPARRLVPQPDLRAEEDLRSLLAQAPPEPAPVEAPPSTPPTRRGPVIATVTVTAAVLLATVLALVLVQPLRARPVAPAASASLGPGRSDGCRPTEVWPVQCGTYRSTYGGARYTGDSGGPARDPLQISFTTRAGRLYLLAQDRHCLTAEVPMRIVGGSARKQSRALDPTDPAYLVRAGAPRLRGACVGGTADERTWATEFLSTDLRTSDAEVFGSGTSSVFFEYQGDAALGEQQAPRNDLQCVAARIAPFDCGAYRSTAGTGSLGFLAERPFQLSFAHLNGELMAALHGRCNGLSASLQTDGDVVVIHGGGSTQALCKGTRGTDDTAVSRFLDGFLTYRRNADGITFTSPTGSATFARTELPVASATAQAPSPRSPTPSTSSGLREGCSPTSAGTPVDAKTASIADVDGDGRRDTEWAVLRIGGTLRFGITTASGATVTGQQGFAGGANRSFVVGRLANGVVVAITSEHRESPVYTFSDCAFHPLHGRDLIDRKADDSPFVLYSVTGGGTGGCYNGHLGLVEHLSDTGDTVARVIDVSGDGRHATLTDRTTPVHVTLPVISCGASPVLTL